MVSTEALYEQYKDALKRGHVASLRGRVDEALVAYAEAARIAPERPTPHASAGTALLRRGRPAEALRQYEVALAIAPRDEAALLGRAQALAALDRRGEAADAFDALADVQASAGRLADAVDAARRGLELAEGRERRRTLQRLIERLRATEPGEPARVALERALQVLEGAAVPVTSPPAATAEGGVAAEPAGPAAAGEASGASATAETVDSAPTAGAAAPGPAGAESDETAAPEEAQPGAVTAQPGPDTATEPEAEAPREATVPTRPASRLVPPDTSAAELEVRADAAVDAGLPGPITDALLGLAAVHVREGRVDAAIDACYTAVSFDPDSVALHLALAELYEARGWTTLADEKLDLLARLAELDGDAAAVAEVAGVRAARAQGR